ncbi:MAG: hypothetical protein H7A33_08315 [Deltaproteobacteria bacterium]|nr:hypothetical protein [Deltaproteobacteria bacterium]
MQKGSRIDFTQDGSIKSGILEEDTIYYSQFYGSIELKAGEKISFYQNGLFNSGVPSHPVTISNKKYGDFSVLEDNLFSVHETGEFKSGTLENELYIINDLVGDFFIIDGKEAIFYKAGSLNKGTLSEDTTLDTIVGNLEFLEQTPITLSEDDDVSEGFVARKYQIEGKDYYVGDLIEIELDAFE